MNILIQFLRGFKCLRLLRHWYRGWKEFLLINGRQILRARRNYAKRLKEIRKKFGRKRLKVLFLVAHPAKWKSQSIYDAMKRSSTFEPILAVTVMDYPDMALSHEQRVSMMEYRISYFQGLGCNVVSAYDRQRGMLSLVEFAPDIVWYTQPWAIDECQGPVSVSQYALTCYTPYFVQNYGGLGMDCLLPFHRFLWRHFALNETWAKVFMRAQGCRRAGKVVGCGHPMLDQFKRELDSSVGRDYIVYAPHFSINQIENYATIHKNGERILALAQQHPELKWAFKPHPNLRKVLVDFAGWSQEKVEAYYKAWERIGIACYDGAYVELFEKSRLMITDCGSFLVEFACTGQPIIRLVSSDALYQPHPIAKKLFSTYYEAEDWVQFEWWFKVVALEGKDPKSAERLEAIQQMHLMGGDVAMATLDYLVGVFS